MFNGTVKVEWLDDKRDMRLLTTLVYTDSDGKDWLAMPGAIIDGASIPKFFWRFIGSPFVGRYRRASVIHDVYCVSKSRPSKDVHKVFYEMMLEDGVPKMKAKAMYFAVRTFGPKW